MRGMLGASSWTELDVDFSQSLPLPTFITCSSKGMLLAFNSIRTALHGWEKESKKTFSAIFSSNTDEAVPKNLSGVTFIGFETYCVQIQKHVDC